MIGDPVARCPRCERELAGLATYCHDCEAYVDDMGDPRPSGASVAPAPRTPAAGIPDTRLEDEIQLATTRALELLGFDVYDLSQGRKTRQTPGLADLYVVGFGRCAWGEMKRAKGKQSEAQRIFEASVQRHGGEYHVWRHENEAIEWAREVIDQWRAAP